jgi:diadenosine tetraphosphate (Ap4A) HIT family hydrolase
VVNNDQAYLGRCYFSLNRHETDVTKLSSDEISDLWALFGDLKAAIDLLWRPDHYNYVFLMNVQPHLHAHIIPRYATERAFDGVLFVDAALGKHYDLENILTPPEETLCRITQELRLTLQSNGRIFE